MRKKEIMKQNAILFDKLQLEEKENFRLLSVIEEKNKEILILKSQLESRVKVEPEKKANTPLEKLEKKSIANVSISHDIDYGAEIIGKIVLKATELSNKLTFGGETKYKELVNLLLGKTEVAKSDILSTVSSENEFEVKKEQILKIEADTYEYFDSVIAQI